MQSELFFGSLACIGSPTLDCKNTTGVYIDGHVVGAIYWMVTSNEVGYNVIMQKNNLGFYATEQVAKQVCRDYVATHFGNVKEL